MAINVRLDKEPDCAVEHFVVLEFWSCKPPYTRCVDASIKEWTFAEVEKKIGRLGDRLVSFYFITKEKDNPKSYPIKSSVRYFVDGVTRMYGKTPVINKPFPIIGEPKMVCVKWMHADPSSGPNVSGRWSVTAIEEQDMKHFTT